MGFQVQNLPFQEYLSNPAYGSSDIVAMGRSFAHWKWRKANPEPLSRPLVIGSATHLLLQAAVEESPALADAGIALYSDGSSLTKGFKQFQADHKGIHCLDLEEKKLCDKMVTSLLANSDVMGYLDGAIPEATVIGTYPGSSVVCKCRPDYLHTGRAVSINIKTARDASESGFISGAKEHQYDWQSAFYCDILSNRFEKRFDEIHIVVEKTDDDEPCPVKIFTFGEDTLAWARVSILAILEKIPECERTGVWPMTPSKLEQIDLPGWARKTPTV